MDSCDGGEADAAVCGGSGMLGRWGVGVPELAGIEGLRDETGNQRVMDIVVQLPRLLAHRYAGSANVAVVLQIAVPGNFRRDCDLDCFTNTLSQTYRRK